MYFDGHSDIWADVNIKTLEGKTDIIKKYHIDRLRKGQIEGAIFVVWVDPPFTDDPKKRTAQIFDSLKKEASVSDDIMIVKSYADIEKAKAAGKFYVIIGMEGISGLEPDVSEIDRVYDLGVRHIIMSWNEENDFATGVKGTPGRGLTELGKAAAKKILSKNMILDVSHGNENTFWDIVNLADGPIVASHSNARALCDVPRNLKDEQLKALADLGGVVGLNAFCEFIDPDKANQSAAGLAKHAAYMADLIGVEHVCCGFDFDGFLPKSAVSGYATQDSPVTKGLEDCSKVPGFFKELKKTGFSDAELEMIAYKNWMRIIKERIG